RLNPISFEILFFGFDRFVGKIFQILLDQRTVFLRIFFRLRLLDRGAVALGQTEKLTGASNRLSLAISAFAGPVSLIAISLAGRLALPLAFSLTLTWSLSLTLAFPLPLVLTTRHLRTQTGLRQSQCRLRLRQRVCRSGRVRLCPGRVVRRSLRRPARQGSLSLLQSGLRCSGQRPHFARGQRANIFGGFTEQLRRFIERGIRRGLLRRGQLFGQLLHVGLL